MKPRLVPEGVKALGIGVPLTFVGPEGSDVGDLQVLVLEDMRAILQGREPDSAKWVSWWIPSQEEINKIITGAPVRLCIIGATHINPMLIGVGANLEGLL